MTNGRLEAVAARAARRDVQEDEAVGHGQLALVDDRPEAAARVDHEVRDRHLTRRDERGPAGRKPDGDEEAAEELDDPRHSHEPREGRKRAPPSGASDSRWPRSNVPGSVP